MKKGTIDFEESIIIISAEYSVELMSQFPIDRKVDINVCKKLFHPRMQ